MYGNTRADECSVFRQPNNPAAAILFHAFARRFQKPQFLPRDGAAIRPRLISGHGQRIDVAARTHRSIIDRRHRKLQTPSQHRWNRPLRCNKLSIPSVQNIRQVSNRAVWFDG
jgi:hypothetical protein